jgi:hypothetical protein
MNSYSEKPSLIPYLKPADVLFYLKLSMAADASPHHKTPDFPFLIVSDTDPLALIMEGTILSDAGASIKPVFLLTQKDEYNLVKDEIYPVTNHDIDSAWQHLFSFLKARNENDAIFLFKDQLGEDGTLLPWSPLFFCQHRKKFFLPPCPACGLPLEMAHDDDLLCGLGLQPYSMSLKRYLFCAHCYDTRGESNFYVRALTSSDPNILRDQQDLISGFDQLVHDANPNDSIPCLKCDDFKQCYETDELAKTRIVSISFYPFYMIALPAPSVHFLDLLPLLAGADVNEPASRLGAEGQWGRLKYLTTFENITARKTHFFFNQDEKFFLEVLYLKLSLLGELSQIIFSGLNTFKYPDLGLSLDRIWVNVAEQSDMLPRYWNFKLQLLGIGLDTAPTPSLSKLPPSYGLYFLGSVWFYVLLVNARMDVSEVYNEVAEAVNKIGAQDTAVSENPLEHLRSAIFSPQNIFWHPNQRTAHTDWTALWEEALNLGFLLLKHGMRPISEWSQTEFWQKLEDLRDTIKKTLFSSETQFAEPSLTKDDEAISDILIKISSKWFGEPGTKFSAPVREAEGLAAQKSKIARADSSISEDMLTKEPVMPSSANSGEKKSPADKLDETILLKPKDGAQAETPESASQVEKDLPQTVILTRDIPETQTPSPTEPRESDIPQTVIISTQKSAPAQKDTDQKPPAEDDRTQPTENGPSKESKNQQAEQKPRDIDDTDDDFPKTVIIDAKKLKNGH